LESYKDNALRGVSEGEAARRDARIALEHQLMSSLPRSRRPSAGLILRLARSTIPLRGVGKAAFLQSLDMARAAARRIGEHLVLDHVIEDRDDVFFLTLDEITGKLPAGAADLIARRRGRYDEYCKVTVPSAWQGMPTPIVVSEDLDAPAQDGDVVKGVGASPGVVEGPIRIVGDPTGDDVEPGEILVAPTTDPSWAAVMYISKALVVDIGGALSHAAIVARELGIPCVVNTKDGTRVLRTGDHCRVDGTTGETQVLKRAIGQR
jgi:pyruvate,water dikinase